MGKIRHSPLLPAKILLAMGTQTLLVIYRRTTDWPKLSCAICHFGKDTLWGGGGGQHTCSSEAFYTREIKFRREEDTRLIVQMRKTGTQKIKPFAQGLRARA